MCWGSFGGGEERLVVLGDKGFGTAAVMSCWWRPCLLCDLGSRRMLAVWWLLACEVVSLGRAFG